MEKTPHVLLAGEGANEFAQEMDVEFETDEYFFTDFRYQQLLNARKMHRVQLDHTIDEAEIIEEVQSSKLKARNQIKNQKSKIKNQKFLCWLFYTTLS